jgi:hypothetical protein
LIGEKCLEQKMPTAVIEDRAKFMAFLSAQPLCQWSVQKQQELAAGMRGDPGRSSIHPPPKNDNAELSAALSSMA